MARSSVTIPLTWEVLSKESDPVAYVRSSAISELRLLQDYDDEEVKFVESDEVFEHSCKAVYLTARKRAEHYHRLEVKHDPKADVTEASWKFSIHFTRPKTRGFLGRSISSPAG